MGIQDQFIHVDHPEFEVHNFHTLAPLTGYSPTGLAGLYARGRFTLLATNFKAGKSFFAIAKTEIAFIKAMRQTSKQPSSR